MQIISIVLAVLALGLLVFIHELGHYLMARRRKMRIEVFSIGFGKPILSWMKEGVKWQICVLPFGGYVKIAGMQKENGKEPHLIKDGFFGKTPLDRIKVAFAGPVVNILFALLAFLGVYLLGGREKPFAQYTHRIGWVDEKSSLFSMGVRPGDEIIEYDNRPYKGIKDLQFAAVSEEKTTRIKGYKIDYQKQKKIPFDYHLKTYPLVEGNNDFVTIGVLSPAKYLIYNPDLVKDKKIPQSPFIKDSGLEKNDRIVWVNGELVFSIEHLTTILNESTSFLTVERAGKIYHTRVPRVKLEALKLKKQEKEELEDWKHEKHIQKNLSDLYFLPYSISVNLQVLHPLSFLEKEEEVKTFLSCQRCNDYTVLQKGDKILAIDGNQVANSYELLEMIQKKNALMIVQKNFQKNLKEPAEKADKDFDKNFPIADLEKIISSIGINSATQTSKSFTLLSPIQLQKIKDMQNTYVQRVWKEQEKHIQKIKDRTKQEKELAQLEMVKNSYYLGISLEDQKVLYNPSPFAQFGEVFSEMQRTFTGLLTGYLSPKHLSGPIGIMYVVQHGWSLGFVEALYWIGMISLNLGLLNLLPFPVLDGGHITFSFIEMITKKPLKAKTMEKLIIPFVVLLIGFSIYVTYHDITRILTHLF